MLLSLDKESNFLLAFSPKIDLELRMSTFPSPYLSPAEVQKIYGLKESSQRTLRGQRKITYTKIAGRVAYKQEWIEAWIDRQTKPAIEEAAHV